MKMLLFVKEASVCVKTMLLPSRDQMGLPLLPCFDALVARRVTFREPISIEQSSLKEASLAFDLKANLLPSGDQTGPSSEISGVFVRLTSCPFWGETRKRSHCSLPSYSEAQPSHVPLRYHAGVICRGLL